MLNNLYNVSHLAFNSARWSFIKRHDGEDSFDTIDLRLKLDVSQLESCKFSVENGRVLEAQVEDEKSLFDVKFNTCKEAGHAGSSWKSELTVESDSCKLLRAYKNLGIANKVRLPSRKRPRISKPKTTMPQEVAIAQCVAKATTNVCASGPMLTDNAGHYVTPFSYFCIISCVSSMC